MEYRCYKSILYILVFIFLGCSAWADSLALNIVYPKENQNMPAIDSSFIFGSVKPGAVLTINNHNVAVHESGGWLAFLPVSPGKFQFEIKAELNGQSESMTLSINLPKLPTYNYNDLIIYQSSMKPQTEIWGMAGDEIDLRFKSLPYCNGFCVVLPMYDTIYMFESAPRYYFGRGNVFDANGESQVYPDSLLTRGVYEGKYTIPGTDSDSLTFIYYIYPPSEEQLDWINNWRHILGKPSLPNDRINSLSSIASDTCPETVRIIMDNFRPTIELIDSLSIIRSAPAKGYLSIHQPNGIRAKLIGKNGRWLKIKLSDYQHGWIIDTCAVILPHTVPVPHSYISKVKTMSKEDLTSVIVSTSGKHPFRVVENIDENSITLFVYGADSDTDWIRYDNNDELIDHIVWFQPEPGVYGLKIYLTADRIWGYDAHYVGSELYFDIKKFPWDKNEIYQYRFVIDPGHSSDNGAVGPTGLTEKEANLAIALMLRKELKSEGAEVILTREDDSHVKLYDRPKIAVREKTDIFISIHNNALPNGINPIVNNGTTTLYYHPHSAKLARAVHQSMVQNLGLNDLGWYYGNLAVNRPTQYPAILVECAFMMIPEQEAKLRTKKFQRKIARAIVEGFKDFLRGHTKTEWDRQQDISYGR